MGDEDWVVYRTDSDEHYNNTHPWEDSDPLAWDDFDYDYADYYEV